MSQIACHKCDLVHDLPNMSEGSAAYCVRCGSVILRTKIDTVNRTLAWTISAFVLFLVAVTFPFLSINSGGIDRHTALLTGIREIHLQGMTSLSFLVLFTCVLAPILQMLGLLYVFVPLKLGVKMRSTPFVFRLFQRIQPWSMMEVFMLGILVALVKLGETATILPGLAVFAFGLLIFALTFAVSSIDIHYVWTRLEASTDV